MVGLLSFLYNKERNIFITFYAILLILPIFVKILFKKNK